VSIHPIPQQTTRTPPREFNLRVGRILKRLREDSGLTQGAVARHLGITYPAYQKYEAGQNRLSLETLVKVSGLIGFDPAAFVRAVTSDTTPVKDIQIQIADASVRKVSDAMQHMSRKEDRELMVDLARRLRSTDGL